MLNEVYEAEAELKTALANLSLLTGQKQMEALFYTQEEFTGFDRNFVLQDLIPMAQNNRADLKAALQSICARRGVQYTLELTLAASAAPSHPDWQARWADAVQSLGLPVFELPSGAGHDAMKLHQVLPQAMLFVRGGHAGISHNPLETITNDDAEPADDYGRVYVTLLNPETGQEEEAPMAFSFSIASLGMRLVKQWDGFPEGVRPLLTRRRPSRRPRT